jgi:cyanophycinase-like exopeptidase
MNTAASEELRKYPEEYVRIFRSFGVKNIHNLNDSDARRGSGGVQIEASERCCGRVLHWGDQLKVTGC